MFRFVHQLCARIQPSKRMVHKLCFLHFEADKFSSMHVGFLHVQVAGTTLYEDLVVRPSTCTVGILLSTTTIGMMA